MIFSFLLIKSIQQQEQNNSFPLIRGCIRMHLRCIASFPVSCMFSRSHDTRYNDFMNDYRYKAFISYRHQAPDQDVAQKLHTLIETFGIPSSIRRSSKMTKMGRVFRDQEELPLSSDLGRDIHEALEQSEWLICICSPRYQESKWCMEELRCFIELGRRDHILAVLTEGEPADSFPDEIRFFEADGIIQEKEPLAADVRASSKEEALKKLNREKLRILAPMLGVTYDDLVQRARKRRTRILTAVISGAFALMSGFLSYAVIKNKEISRQRDLAMDNQLQLLIEQSNISSSSSNKLAALKQLTEASEIRKTVGMKRDDSMKAALEYALYTEPFENILHIDANNRQFDALVFSHDSRYILGITNLNSACLIDAETGKILITVSQKDTGQLDSVGFTLDDRYFYMVDSWYGYVSLYDVNDGSLYRKYEDENTSVWQIGEKVFPLDEKSILIIRQDVMVIWDYADDTQKEILPCGDGVFEGYLQPFIVDVSPDHKDAVIGSHGYGIGMKILSLDGKKEIPLEFDAERGYMNIRYSGNGKRIAAVSGDMYVVYDAETGKQILSGSVEDISASPDVLITYDGDILLVMTSDLLRAVSVNTGGVLWEKTAESNVATEACLSFDGRYVSAEGGIAGIFDIRTGEMLCDQGASVFSHDSTRVIADPYTSQPSLLATPLYATQYTEDQFSQTLYSTPRFTDPEEMINIELKHNTSEIYSGPERQEGIYTSENVKYCAKTHKDGFIEIFDISDADNVQNIYCLAEHCYNCVTDLLFSDTLMASCGGYDPRCVLFDLETGAIRFVLAGEQYCHEAEFSPDGSKIIILCGYARDRAFVYSAESGNLLYTFRCDEEHQISGIGFSTDGTTVAAVLNDGSALAGRLYPAIDDLLLQAESR